MLKGNITINSGTLFKFTYKIQIGGRITFPSKSERMINIGIIEDESITVTADEIREDTLVHLIKEIGRQPKDYDFEGLVANALEGMGYRTKISQYGSDKSRDIITYLGELPSRIVQSKNQDSKVSSPLARDLRNAIREGDYGFFVALSNCSKDAKGYLRGKIQSIETLVVPNL